jgi:hypothetical protein
MDIHVPSEHTQEGKRYSAEIQLAHFYSIVWDNEMATVSIFMEAYDDAPPYKFLDKVICQWRRKEYETRLQCGLDPIDGTYPGCFPLTRRDLKQRKQTDSKNPQQDDKQTDSNNPQQDENSKSKKRPKFRTVADIIEYNEMNKDNPDFKQVQFDLEDINYDPAEEKDWPAWIEEQSQRMKQEEELYKRLRDNDYGGKHTDEMHEKYRRLIMGDETEWYNYFPMLGARTEVSILFVI